MRKLFLFITFMFAAQMMMGQTTDIVKLQEKAEQGEADAQNKVGIRFKNGEGVDKDW